MNFIYRLSLLSSFIGLWITSLLPERFELFIGFLLIFTFGMVHGSNDLLIVKILTKKDSKTSFLKIRKRWGKEYNYKERIIYYA